MEGSSEEDYLDSLLDSVSVVKDDVVEDELFDEETNELIGALNDIMESVEGMKTDDSEMISEEAIVPDEPAADSEEGAVAESDKEENAQIPQLSELVLDDDLKELLGEGEETTQSPQIQESLTKEQEERLSQMDAESLLREEDKPQEAMEESLSLEGAIENGGLWEGNGEALDDIPEDLDALIAMERGEKPKKGLKALLQKLFGRKTEKKEKKPQEPKKAEVRKEDEQPAREDENAEVLSQVFDDQGELIENEKKKVKKKNFFTNFLEKLNEDDDEEEDLSLEKVVEKKPRKEKKPPKEKKPKEKKPKKPKPAKPKKEKKPKPPVKPSEMIRISKAGILIMLIFIVGVSGFAYFGINTYAYNNNIMAATEYLVSGNYGRAYTMIDGLKLKTEADELLYKQITVIMYVDKKYDSFVNYRKLGMEYEALDSLIQGIARYYEFRETGEELGVLKDMDNVKAKIVLALDQNYGISEALALTYSEIEDVVQYYYIISSYGGQ